MSLCWHFSHTLTRWIRARSILVTTCQAAAAAYMLDPDDIVVTAMCQRQVPPLSQCVCVWGGGLFYSVHATEDISDMQLMSHREELSHVGRILPCS